MSVAAAASRRKQAKPTKLPTTPPPTLELSAQEATKNGVERHDEEASQITSNGSRKRPSSPISIEEQFRNQLKENHLLLSNGKRFITSPEVLPTTMTTNGDAIDLSQKPQNESTEYPMFDEKTSLLFDKLSQQYILELYKTQNAQNLATISGGSSDVPSCSNSASGRTSVLSSFNENGSSFDKLYACSVENCSETFTKRGSFLWHVTSEHAAENLLQCDECEETFSDVIQLRQHRCGSAVPRPISVLPREHEELELARKAPSVPAMGECVPFHFRDEVNQMHRLEEESSTDDDDKTQINEDSSLMMGPPLLTNQLLGGLGQNQSDMSSTSMPNMGNNALDLSMSSLNNNKLNFGNNNGQFSEQAPFLAFNPMMQMRSPFDRGNPAMFMPSGMLTAPNNTNGSSSINNDDDWESMMEINTSDEAEKIRALIGDKPLPTTDPNQCIVCRRVLSCKSALQMHYRTHTGERPFKCKICQRAFTTKGNLKTHMGVHRGKPHSLRFVTGPANVGSHACPICQKRFPSSQMLQQHVAQHTNQLRAGILPPLQFDMMKPPSSEAMSATPNPFLPQHFLSSPNPANFPPFPIFPGLLNFPGANPFMNNPMNISFPMPGSEISTSMGIPSTPSTPSVPTSATPVVEVKTKIEEEKPKPASNLVNKPPTIELPPLPAMLAPKATTSSVANSGGKKVAEEKDPIKSHSEPKVTPMKPTEVPAPSSLNRFGLWKIATPEKISSISETNEQSPKKEPEIKVPGLSSPLSLLKKPVEVDKKIKSVPSSTSLASSVNSENSVITPTPKMETPTLKSELKLHEPLVTPEEGRSSDGSQSDENPLAAIEKMWAEKEPAKEASRPSMTLQKHQCGVCYKHFSSSSALQIHMRTHTGDKPFKCHVCSRAFTTRGNLKVHMTTHENQHNPSRRGRRIFDFVPDSTRLDVARQQLLASVNSAVSPQTMSPILPLLGIPSLGFPPFFSSADTIVTSPSTAVATPTTQMDAMFLLAWNMCPICQKVIANPQEKEQHFKSHLESFTANSAGISNSNNQQSTKLL